ncbi:MAG: enolase C-terminal domain-like protein [Hyphomicrobiales bacterium]
MSAPSNEKIVSMDVWHLALPVTSRRDHGSGTVAGDVEVVIVCLTSEGGTKGYGEASPWAVFTGTAENTFSALDRYVRPVVVGACIEDIPAIMEAARKQVVNASEAFAALETALFDLLGKIRGLPIWALLGGKYRDEIPLSVSLANPNFDEDLELCERLKQDDVGLVKIKTGIKDHAFDVMRVERLRQDHPQLDIRIDYNQGLHPTGALRKLKDMDQFQVTFIEQPVARQHYSAMANFKRELTTPLLADESVFSPNDMLRAIREDICDCVSVKIMKSGSLTTGKVISEMAAAAGMAAYGGDMFETGIAHLAGTHMIAASPHITLGCEFYQATYYLEEDLLAAPFPISKGKVQVPHAPGLGIEVNERRLERYARVHSPGGLN